MVSGLRTTVHDVETTEYDPDYEEAAAATAPAYFGALDVVICSLVGFFIDASYTCYYRTGEAGYAGIDGCFVGEPILEERLDLPRA